MTKARREPVTGYREGGEHLIRVSVGFQPFMFRRIVAEAKADDVAFSNEVRRLVADALGRRVG